MVVVCVCVWVCVRGDEETLGVHLRMLLCKDSLWLEGVQQQGDQCGHSRTVAAGS